ncbi:MAG: PqqD family protein [Eubacterium sp.]|nr:PqqD family protein [Eubacterium sp.]
MKIYRTKDDYILRVIAGDAVLVPVGEDCAFKNAVISLNGTGAFIWKSLADGASAEAVIESAREEYEDEDGKLEENVRGFIGEGVRLGMITETEEDD